MVTYEMYHYSDGFLTSKVILFYFPQFVFFFLLCSNVRIICTSSKKKKKSDLRTQCLKQTNFVCVCSTRYCCRLAN